MAKLIKQSALQSPLVSFKTGLPQDEPNIQTAPFATESEIQILKESAYQQGYLSGQNDTKALLDQEMAVTQQQLEALIHSIPKAISQNRLDLRSEITDIVLLIIQQFFIEQQGDTKALEQQINHILSQINSKETLSLCLHPQDAQALHQGAIHLKIGHLKEINITRDSSLVLGGCLIKTEHGLFDASIEKQIDRLKEVLLQMRQGVANAAMD
ncbi:MAG: FliH/SctL family protein [Legionellales bacterium]